MANGVSEIWYWITNMCLVFWSICVRLTTRAIICTNKIMNFSLLFRRICFRMTTQDPNTAPHTVVRKILYMAPFQIFVCQLCRDSFAIDVEFTLSRRARVQFTQCWVILTALSHLDTVLSRLDSAEFFGECWVIKKVLSQNISVSRYLFSNS